MFKFWQHFTPHFSLEDHNDKVDNYRDSRNPNTQNKNVLYFWGFYLGKKRIPKNKKQCDNFWKNVEPKDIIIYYIGVKEQNDTERLLQHFASLFGGYYTIINWKHLKSNSLQARLKLIEVFWGNRHPDNNKHIHNIILHTSESHSALRKFHNSSNNNVDDLSKTIDKMKERLIFDVFYLPQSLTGTQPTNDDFENTLHQWLSVNVLGTGNRKILVSENKSTDSETREKLIKIGKQNRLLARWILSVAAPNTIRKCKGNYKGSDINSDYYQVGRAGNKKGKCSNCDFSNHFVEIAQKNWRKNTQNSKLTECTLNLCKRCYGRLLTKIKNNEYLGSDYDADYFKNMYKKKENCCSELSCNREISFKVEKVGKSKEAENKILWLCDNHYTVLRERIK